MRIRFSPLLSYSLTLLLTASVGFTADFINIGVGARAQGLGGAFTALADDVSSIYWNPAGLSCVKDTEMTFMHNKWIEDTSYEFYGLATPAEIGGYKCVLGFGMHYMNLGSFTGRKDQVSAPVEFSASDMAFSMGFGMKLDADNSIGMNLKYIEESIEAVRAEAFALDLGLKHVLSYDLTLAFTLQNLGGSMKYVSEAVNLPLNVSAGLGYRINGALDLGLVLRQEIYGGRTELSFGSEYAVSNALVLRGGSLLNSLSGGNNPGLSGGFGIKLGGNQLDYAVSTIGELGPTQKVSFSLKF